MTTIHPTAIIEEGAELDVDVVVGPYAVVGPHVKIGARTQIGPHSVVEGNTTLGPDNRIFQFASVGAIPQDLKYAGEPTRLEIGAGNQIREFTTLHIGTEGGGGLTRLGDHNLLMAYSHVAHDCRVGNRCVLANSVALAGHVEVGDHVILGGLSAVHQFTRIGPYAFVAGGSMVVMDVPPYCTVQGDRAELAGLNTVGLARHGFGETQISRIKQAYKTLFRSKLGLNEALTQVRAEYGDHEEVLCMLTFLEDAKRGVTR